MLDIAADLARWTAEKRAFAVATVVAVRGSAPRGPGAALAVDAAGTALGSVSGGCVEASVYELCREVLDTGVPVLTTFGYAAEDAFAAGLSCGGELDVFVAPPPADPAQREVFAAAYQAGAAGAGAALAQVTSGPPELLGRALLLRPGGEVLGDLGGGEAFARGALAETRALLDAGRTATVVTGAEGERCGEPVTLFVESATPPPRLLVFGAIDFAAALVRAGKFLGMRVTVCDARPVFATPARFPEADEVVVEWPDSYLARTATDARTAVCVLSHDAKFDVPLLALALRRPLAYVGAMGSRRTHLDRLGRLREAGLSEAELAPLRSPIGLDLGARTPEETALSIAAEIVAARHGGSGRPLTGAHTPIHREVPGTGSVLTG
ncbi:XdhC family protein [Streptomyces physcomitrii]|uniref:XdhC family protein n=1 Tax=Streptomyces physcomitrii TaxID=2724184 RepID=A0ABX1HDP0_9ACTN|nr:XdhC/CoxI family protein [Streptomyces physcomitrii]NKI45091.1 XdhC family protein [Streptomyces physcomitrii]